MAPVLRVLMLIDSEADSDMLARELVRAGFELNARRASTEAAYLAALEAPLDLILADNALREFDAMRALQILRTHELDIPLIVITEASGEEAAIECVSLGADDFVFRDRPVRLRSAVVRALDRRELRAHARASEAALRDSEKRFRTTFEQAATGIAHIALSGQILRVNRRICDIFESSQAELLDSTIDDLNAPDLVLLVEAGARRLLAREISSYATETSFARKDGAQVWVNITVSLVSDDQGAPSYYIALVEDISERRKADATRALLAAIVDASDDAIIGIAPDGMVMTWNTGAEHVYGYRADQMLGRPIALLRPAHLQQEVAHLYDRLASGEDTAYIETARLRSDGQLIDVALTISAIRDAGGRFSGFSTISRDISARKRGDRVLRQKTAFIQLFQEVAVAANQAASLDQALQTTIDTICTHIGWPVGHVYLPDPRTPGGLVPSGIWHLEDQQRFAAFRTITEAVRLAPGVGVPGQAMASRKPAWIADMILDKSTPRTRVIKDIGVRAGFALPVVLGDHVAAVLEFFATEAIEPDEALLDVLQHVGTQLGRVVERAQAEAALRESESRFRALFEHSPDAIFLIDPHDPSGLWPIVECNDIACQMNGYTREELIGQSIELLNDKIASPAAKVAYVERLRRDGAIRAERLHRRKDGSLFSIEVVASLISLGGRELILGIDRDISERKRAEDVLRAAEAKYRTLVEQIPAVIYTAAIDESSSTRYVSPQIETILGFTPEEWLANPELWLDQVHPDDRARVLELVGQAQASDVSIPAEFRSFTRDGRVVWLRDAARVVRDESGQPLFMQGITLDITDRKRAEEALHTSERLYRTLASNFPNGAVVLFDHDLRFTIADGAGLSAFGLTREEMEGRTIWDISTPALGVEAEPDYRAALAGMPHVREITIDERAYVVHILPVRDERGEIIAGMLMSQDITERKRIEEALIDERALLARRVDERTADLSAANAELARAAMLKDEFLASMSHELRTPLNAVLGLSEAMQEEVYGPLNERQIRALGSIAESGRHLLDLINDILDLAKIGAGKLELDVEPTPIAPICQASLRMIKQIAQAKQLSVSTTIDPAVALLNVDARRLKQILVNLLSNAAKFTPDRGSIGLEVLGDTARQVVELTVWDTGIGIAQEQISRLFQPFVQLDSRLARQYEGTGLGLALVYRMVELHGGSVAVTSEVGRGSRFTVALPWLSPGAGAPALADLPAGDRTRIQRALVVEDSPTTAEQIARYLNELAITTEIVRDGADALAQALAAPPDLILLDLLLADSSGWDVLAQLKAEPRTRAIPVVVASAVDERARGLALGAADYLVKPVARADLQRVLGLPGPGAPEVGVPPAPSRPARATAPLVLLAEDNEANITMISDYLDMCGYQVVVARNGAEAIARARETRPALVVMDIQMPGMDGIEATRRIRTMDDLASLPIIALTALAMPGDRERCLAAGANEYLSKPVSLHGLALLIERHLIPHSSQQRNLQ